MLPAGQRRDADPTRTATSTDPLIIDMPIGTSVNVVRAPASQPIRTILPSRAHRARSRRSTSRSCSSRIWRPCGSLRRSGRDDRWHTRPDEPRQREGPASGRSIRSRRAGVISTRRRHRPRSRPRRRVGRPGRRFPRGDHRRQHPLRSGVPATSSRTACSTTRTARTSDRLGVSRTCSRMASAAFTRSSAARAPRSLECDDADLAGEEGRR